MTDERGTLRRVDWQELCPWLLILKSFRLAIGVRILVLAYAGLLVSSGGWWVIGKMFSGSESLKASIEKDCHCPLGSALDSKDGSASSSDPSWWNRFTSSAATGPIEQVWTRLSEPFVRIFRLECTFVELAYSILGGVWSVAVWSLFGGAIARIAALAFTREDQVGIRNALSFAGRKWTGFFLGPLFPFAGVLLATIPLFVLGLLFRVDFFLALSVILWPLALIAGAFLAVIVLGLFFGWPLMWGTIGTEGTDAFDSLSRSYNYIRERPLHYLFYVALAAFFGALGGFLVHLFAGAVVMFGTWAISWGMGTERIKEIAADSGGFSHGAIEFWNECVHGLSPAFAYGFFFASMTAVYLLMRLKVDSMELDEIFSDEEEQSYSMPPLATDGANVPTVADAPPATPNPPANENP